MQKADILDKINNLKKELRKQKTMNEGLKICLNGSYGKMGSMYSSLYSPETLLQVTLTGQLVMLMLIETLENNGFKVVSSNTDGVEYVCEESRIHIAEALIFEWELDTQLVMEHGEYDALYARDVNNYVAVYPKYTKAKGVYSEATLQKNSEYPIVFSAIRRYLFDNEVLMEDTIRNCTDVRQFLTARTVRGGGVWNEEYLGKVVRWYYSTKGNSIHYKTNNNKVPKSDGAHPMMNLTEDIPADLDYDKYISLAVGHLADLGISYG